MSQDSVGLSLRNVLRRGGAALKRVVAAVAGEWTWTRPAWLERANLRGQEFTGAVRRRPRRSLGIAAAALAVIAAGWLGWRWYDALPKPVEIAFTVIAPQRTCYECEPPGKPNPLVVRFDDSVAPLADSGHPLDPARRHVVLKPSFEGTWTWDDDRTLRFVPASDWPIGVEYQVSFARKGFAAGHVRLAEDGFEFRAPAFEARVASMEFYQDPVRASDKKVVATVAFSHPVEPGRLEELVSLKLFNRISAKREEAVEPAPDFAVTYDKLKLQAFVHSAQLAVPAKEGRVELAIRSGLAPARGGNRIEERLVASVAVPGLYSLGVTALQARIVRDERDEPGQTLFVGTSHSVTEAEIASRTHAWVLPETHPDPKRQAEWEKRHRQQPYRWSGSQEVSDAVLEAAAPLALDPVPGEREHSELSGFRFQAEPGRWIYVRVDRGLKSFGGFLMPEAAAAVVAAPAYPRELRITHRGSLLALSGQRKLTVFARGVPAVRVQVGRLLPNQLQHLVSQSTEVFDRPRFENWNFGEMNLTERFAEVIALPGTDPRAPQYTALDLGRYLGREGAGRGVFLLTVEGWDPVTSKVVYPERDCAYDCDETATTRDTRMVVVTDLGLLVKQSLDGSQDLFVQSIASGMPVAGVTVEVIGRNGEPVHTAVTDAEGHLRFADLRPLKEEQEPVLYLARLGGDSTFLPIHGNLRPLDLSRFDVGGVSDVVDRARLTAYLFSDRGLYRPGDEIRAGAIVKAQDWRRLPEGMPLRVEVVDPRGVAVRRETIRLSAGGIEEIRHRTPATAPTGEYTLQVSVLKEQGRQDLIGSMTVSVREFLPDRLRLRTRFSTDSSAGWVSPEGLAAEIDLENLFGTPAADRRVTATMSLTPATPEFASYPEYRFHDPLASREGITEALGEARTGADGKAAFALDLKRFTRATYRVSLLIEGFEADGGRGVTAQASQLVSSLPFLVGWKADGGLEFVPRGSPRKLSFIAIDPAARKVAARELKLRHIERRYVSMLIRQDNGLYRYQSRLKEIPVREQPFEIGEAGATVVLDTTTPGNFTAVVVDAAGQVFARAEFTVAGAANLARSLERNAELEVTLDRQDYSSGDEIELSIRAPYTGAGLITIERDRVYAHRWFRSTTTSSVQRIRLPPGIEGNAFVNVTFVRDPGSEEIYTSPLSWGVKPFSIALGTRRNSVTLQVGALAAPGQKLAVSVSSAQPSRIVLFAVDEGILQVARYRTPDPLGYFFAQRALSVGTRQILDMLLPEFRAGMLKAPGGDAESALANRLNPFQRKTEPPVAWWSGIIEAGSDARRVEVPVPDYFNGTLRVMAVAVADGSVGAADAKVVVRGDFVLSPNTPLTVTPGDEFDVSVGVANNVKGSGPDAAVAVGLKASEGLAIVGAREASVAIGEMREGSARFRVRALDRLGAGSLTFSARTGGKSATRAASLSVRPASPHWTLLSAGSFENRIEVPVTREMYPQFRRLRAAVSPLPLALAHGLTSYLGHYTYDCTEQVVSQAIPAIVLAERPEFGAVKVEPGANLAGLVDELRVRQDGHGAYRYWPGGVEVNAFVSVYAQHVLLEASERKMPVPGDLLESGNDYLREVAASDPDDLAGERTVAYAIYLLARQGQAVAGETAALQRRLESRHAKTWRSDVAAAYLAATYRLQRQDSLAANAISVVQRGDTRRDDHWHDAMTRDAVLLYLLSRHFPDRLAALPEQFLETMVARVRNGEHHSLSAATTVLALDAYATAAAPVATDHLGIRAKPADRTARVLPLPPGVMPSVDFPADAAALEFSGPPDLRSFYLLDESGFDLKPTSESETAGMEILREYLDAAGKPVGTVRVGDEVTVRVKFRAVQRDAFEDAVLVDLLPGGFDLVVPSAPPAEQAYYTASTEEGEEADADVRDRCACPFLFERPRGFPNFADLREDRVVLYGQATPEIQTYTYRIKATNAGDFAIPPAHGESMYSPRVRARSASGRIKVEQR